MVNAAITPLISTQWGFLQQTFLPLVIGSLLQFEFNFSSNSFTKAFIFIDENVE